MQLEYKSKNLPYLLIKIKGELDMYNSFDFKKKVLELVDDNEKPVIIDLKELEYIDSSGISVILKVYTKLQKRNQSVYLVHLKEAITRLIELTSLNDLLPIVDSVKDAVMLIKEKLANKKA